MPFNKEERDLFESISHEKHSPIAEKYRAELEKIDYMNETNKHPYYLKTIKEYARETSDARVNAFIETFKYLGKYPDEEDLAAFTKELNEIVLGFKDIFARVYKHPLAPDVPQTWIDAVLSQLSGELGMIPGLYSLPSLHRFIREGKVAKQPTVSAPITAPAIDFSFLADSRIADIVGRDYNELQKLDPSQSIKSIIVLSGGIIEGLLFDALVACGHWTFDEACQRYLKDMIYPAKNKGIIRHDNLTDVLRVFRNIIHPAREIKDTLDFNESHAKHSRAAVDVVINEVREWHMKRKANL